MKEIEHAKQVKATFCMRKSLDVDLQNVEERFKELESDKTRLDQDKSTAEKQLKETEGVRRNLVHKNRVGISMTGGEELNLYFCRSMRKIFLI